MGKDSRILLRYSLLICVIFFGLVFIFGSGSGGSDDGGTETDNPPASEEGTVIIESSESNPGVVSFDSDTGVSVYEGDENEVATGLLFKRSAALIPNNPSDETAGYKGLVMLRFTNTTDTKQEIVFFEDIPKILAEDVNQIKFKMLTEEAESLSIQDALNDGADFSNITDLVNAGYAQIVDEDPSIVATLGLPILAGLVVVYTRAEWLGTTPKMDPSTLEKLSDTETLQWMDDRLGKYCDLIRKSAEQNNIPPRLLATVILNELGDYDVKDQLQEIIDTGTGRSHGWVQLQVDRVRNHKLIDIGPSGTIRDPSVDIDESLTTKRIYNPYYDITIDVNITNKLILQRIRNPESGIELAAREISFLLDMLKEGSVYANNPWAGSLLKDPSAGIDRDNIYSNLKMDPDNKAGEDPIKQQIELEKTLALLVVSGYNGGGAIYTATDQNAMFKTHNNPWMVDDASALEQPRDHAVNAMFFSDVLYRSWCFKESGGEDPGGKGDISFTLTWSWYDSGSEGPDIDMWVLDPNGYRLSTSRDGYGLGPSPDNGQIDVDDRGAFGDGDGGGPERTFWPSGQAPAGKYTYGVRYYQGDGAVSYILNVYKGTVKVDSKSGYLSEEGGSIEVGSYTL